MSNSYNGWPGIETASDPRLTVIEPVPGRKFRVRAGDVATVFTWLIQRFHNEVEAIDQGILDDWSYSFRKVRGGSTLSNHGSATAVDLNATKHPFNTKATANFSSAQIAAIQHILDDAVVNGQHVLRWLDGHDPMHFEINYIARGGTPANVAALAQRVAPGGTGPGAPAPAPIPTVPAVDTIPQAPRYINWTNPDEALVRITQEIVGVTVDGERGPKTLAATKTHQRMLKIKNADSLFGPTHAEAYLLSLGNMYRAKPDAEMEKAAIKLLHWIAALPIDDSFGPGLETAVKRMQAWAGLYPDGNVGDDTKKAVTR